MSVDQLVGWLVHHPFYNIQEKARESHGKHVMKSAQQETAAMARQIGKKRTGPGPELDDSVHSKLLKDKDEAEVEAEHDIMAMTADSNGLVIIFIQVSLPISYFHNRGLSYHISNPVL